MNKEEAEEVTQALAQSWGGSYRLTASMVRQGVPKALGMKTADWVHERLGGYIKMSISDRRDAVRNLTDEGHSQRETADILGVSNFTISEDVRNLTPEEESETPSRKDSQLVQQSLSNEHYTPKEYIEAARAVLGQIDLDPASCEEANKIVGAVEFYSEKDDALQRKWRGKIWLNPPYGGLAAEFVTKLMAEKKEGYMPAAIVLVNAHCTDTNWFQPLWNGLLCFTDHRINFYGDNERSGSTHGSVFVYLGQEREKFIKEFSRFGAVVARVR